MSRDPPISRTSAWILLWWAAPIEVLAPRSAPEILAEPSTRSTLTTTSLRLAGRLAEEAAGGRGGGSSARWNNLPSAKRRMSAPSALLNDLSEEAVWRLEEICNRFERSWKAGRRPRPEEVLAGSEGGERLAVLRELLPLIPGAHYIYLGDTARLPYGSKSPTTIARYAVESARFLESHGADRLQNISSQST